MESILFLAYTESNGSLNRGALEALSAALKVQQSIPGAQLIAGLAGENIQSAAATVAGAGATRVLAVQGSEFSQPRYSTDAAAAESLCRAAGASIVVCAGNSRGNRVLSGVAHRVGGRIDTHACDLTAEDGGLHVTRWYYRQRMRAVRTRTQRPWFIACDPGCFAPWKGNEGSATVEAVSADLASDAIRTKVTGVQEPTAGEQTIRPDAELLFVAGAGWTKAQAGGQQRVNDAERLILGFLANTQASLGGSKSMVDLSSEGQKVLSFMTHLNQIGQTGSTPRHSKGLATCCHGEEPHVVGWRFINERRAVNTDPNCGWAQGKADVLYVQDAFAVIEKVNELLAKG